MVKTDEGMKTDMYNEDDSDERTTVIPAVTHDVGETQEMPRISYSAPHDANDDDARYTYDASYGNGTDAYGDTYPRPVGNVSNTGAYSYDAIDHNAMDEHRRKASVVKGALVFAFVASIIIAGVLFIGGLIGHNGDVASDSDSTQTSESTPSPSPAPSPKEEMNADLDLTGIEGQYWSNAQKILESRNADMTDALILTDDGKEPIVPSNWTVKSIERLSDGKLEIHLNHTTDVGEQASNTLNDLADKAKGIWHGDKDAWPQVNGTTQLP